MEVLILWASFDTMAGLISPNFLQGAGLVGQPDTVRSPHPIRIAPQAGLRLLAGAHRVLADEPTPGWPPPQAGG